MGLIFLSKKDYCKIEVVNRININVCCYENKVVYPVYLSNRSFNDYLDLLLISNDFTNHYVYIKDFNRLMFNNTRHKGKKYFFNIQNNDNKCFLWCHVRHLNLDVVKLCRITNKER